MNDQPVVVELEHCLERGIHVADVAPVDRLVALLGAVHGELRALQPRP